MNNRQMKAMEEVTEEIRREFLEASLKGDEGSLEEILGRAPKIGLEVGSLKGLKRTI